MDLRLIIAELVPAPEYFGAFENNTEEEYNAIRWVDSRPQPTWDDIVAAALPVAKKLKKEEMAQKRWEEETAGMYVNGIKILTDEISQVKLTGAAVKAMLDPTYVCKWKAGNRWVDLDASTILQIADEVRQHIQYWFDHESNKCDEIDSKTTIEDVENVTW